MAKGEITFYFDTLADLQAQLLETLGMGTPAGADRPVAWPKEGFKYPTPETIRGDLGTNTTATGATTQGPLHPAIEPTKAQMEEAGKIAGETAQAIRTASGITEAARKANQEAAAAEMAAATAAAVPVVEALQSVAAAVPPPPEQNAPTLTLETLAAAPYPELLAFCACNPEVGVNADKCGPTFFRPLVESKIKTYLETK